jgi:hypothetical protein
MSLHFAKRFYELAYVVGYEISWSQVQRTYPETKAPIIIMGAWQKN